MYCYWKFRIGIYVAYRKLCMIVIMCFSSCIVIGGFVLVVENDSVFDD